MTVGRRGARRRTVLAAMALGLATLTGCVAAPPPSDQPIGDRPVRVTTTTNFITDTVARIGGDRVEVSGLMGPASTRTCTGRAQATCRRCAARTSSSTAGCSSRGEMADLFADLSARQLTKAVTDDIPRDAAAQPGTRHHGAVRPARLVRRRAVGAGAAARSRPTLADRDPAHAADYRAGLDSYLAELTALDALRPAAARVDPAAAAAARHLPRRVRVLRPPLRPRRRGHPGHLHRGRGHHGRRRAGGGS